MSASSCGRRYAGAWLRAVQHLATDETEKEIALLARQGRVTEVAGAADRISAIARDYAAKPENTIIVCPDNLSCQQINEAVRGELLRNGTLSDDGQQFPTLSHRSDMTGPDRTWAAMYRPGDVVQYDRGSKAEGIERGSFGVVRSSDGTTNRLTVEMTDGSSVTYDRPREPCFPRGIPRDCRGRAHPLHSLRQGDGCSFGRPWGP